MKTAAAALVLCLGVNAIATAAILSGTVTNGTTGQPAAGDEVAIVSQAGDRIATGKTDAGGRFRFTIAGPSAARVVRVVHQALAYNQAAPAGAGSIAIRVYDAAPSLEGVVASLHWHRLQVEGDTLQVIEEITVRNASNPPRTLSNDRPFEIQLPPSAEILGGRVQAGGGRPLAFTPTPGGRKGQYYFPVPLRPGDTRFAVAYRLPYLGEAVIEPEAYLPLERVVVTLPKSMKFEARTPGLFQLMPGQTSANVYETGAVKAGQSLAFRVSGAGTLLARSSGQPPAQKSEAARSGGVQRASPQNPPAARPQYGWFLLGALALVVASGAAGFLSHKRKQPRSRGSVIAAPSGSSRQISAS